MNAFKHKGLFALALGALLTLAACGGGSSSSSSSSSAASSDSAASSSKAESTSESKADSSSAESTSEEEAEYVREDDEEVYLRELGDFYEKYDGVTTIADDAERFAKYARAEAALLESGAFAPTTTNGGGYAITRAAPRGVPYVFFGNDEYKLKGIVVTSGVDSFIKAEDRAALLEQWENAKAGNGVYDPAAYLRGKGYTIGDSYKQATSKGPGTLDSLATSKQVDTEQMVNCAEGLIQYNNLGQMVGASADRWENVNNESTKYRFHIREGAAWYNSDRSKYADVTADDFVAGFQHMLDADGGLDYLVDGVVKGVHEYLSEGGSFKNVGCYVDDEGWLVFELARPESYFLTRLAYSCFLPMNRAFFLSQGGAFGRAEYKTASADANYKYGTAMNTVLYNSAYIPTNWDLSSSGGSIVLTKNENYWDVANVNLNKLTWVFDDGSNPVALYQATRQGEYPGVGLGEASGLLKLAKDDGLFDTYSYVSDTDSTTFFGGFNLNRGSFNTLDTIISTQDEEEKILTHTALQSQNFRRALLHGWDRGTWNAPRSGDVLKYNNLRNMYCTPDFVTMPEDYTLDGVELKKGDSYGDMVQKFLDNDGEPINVADGQDGWYNLDAAGKFMAAAREELKDIWPADEKIVIETVVYSPSKGMKAQGEAYKQVMEAAFPNDITVELLYTDNVDAYYAAGYDVLHGEEENQDIFYGSGWGPDYGDPSTYLDTFAPEGYMCKVLGLF